MSVFIDIPGVGNVEAKNAASEATLQAILRAMQGVQRNTRGSGGGGGGGGGGNEPGKQSANASAAMFAFGSKVRETAQTIVRLGDSVTGVISRLAGMGDSVTSAADVFSGIPIVGTVFKAVAGAVENTTAAFQTAAQSGATFSGSINQFAGAASAAGMTMKDYAGLVKESSAAFRLLGGNTDAGAKRFAAMSSDLRRTSKDLYALGFSTADVNKGLANYTKVVMVGGRNSNMTNAQLVEGSKKYLRELDLMAKITGEERGEKQKQMEKLMADAQYQAAISGLDEKVAESFRLTVGGLPGPLQDVAKDIMATGSATTDESRKFMSMMPQSAAMMADFAQKTQRGEQVSAEERNKLNNMLREEGKAAQLQYRDVGRYSKEFATITNQFNSAAQIGKDTANLSAKAQQEAIDKTDGQAASLEAMKQTIAGISNSFQMVLANAGDVLNGMMKMLIILTDVIQKYVVPIFQNYLIPAVVFAADVIANILIPGLMYLFEKLIEGAKVVYEMLTPVFKYLGTIIKEYVLPAFLTIKQFLQDHWMPVLLAVGSIIAVKVIPAMITMAAQAVLAGIKMMASMLPLALTVLAVVGLFVGIKIAMRKFGVDLGVVSDGFSWLWSYLQEFGQNLTMIYYKIMDKITPGDKYKDLMEEQAKEIKETTDKRAALEEKMQKDMLANKKKFQDEDKKREAEKNNEKIALAQGNLKDAFNIPDLKINMPAFGNSRPGGAGGGGGGGAGSAESSANAGPTDFTNMSPEAVAAYAYKQNFAGSTAAGEAQKKDIISKSVKEAEEKAKAEAEAKKNIEKQNSPPAKPQESAETLLANLNTKMEQLIRINKGMHDLSDRQLNVQRKLGNDVFYSPGGA
jgi:hypothetical protein